jgi:Na+-transporting methylmalonyl-CoA/oxaloacetate decarboxylase gamma subunit
MKRDILSVGGIVFISLSLLFLAYLFVSSLTKQFFNQDSDYADTWMATPTALSK